MDVESKTERKSILAPIDRLSEILFGLIMVLTFTGSLSVATADHADVKVMLVGALGCNIAWGIIDAIMYLMACLNEHGMRLRTVRAVRGARSREEAHAVIRENVPGVVAAELTPELLDRIRHRVDSIRTEARRPLFSAEDLRGALGVFLMVVVATLPVVLPFLFMGDVALAMRLSNAIAIIMLALIGYFFGRVSGLSPWLTALAMVLIGVVLVALTMALGG